MFQRILVPLDGSELAERVLPYVRLLGKAADCHLSLLRIVDPVPLDLRAIDHGLSHGEVFATRIEHARDSLEATATSLKQDGLQVSAEVVEGIPADHIVVEAATHPDTLIAMSTHGRSGISRWIMGSVTDKVLHATANPMLIVRSGEGQAAMEPDLRSAIVPLDGSSLSEQVLDHIVPIAKALGLKITLVQAVPEGEERYGMVDHPGQYYEKMIQESYSRAEQYLQGVNRQITLGGALQIEEVIPQASPADAIIDIAHQTPLSLVAMTTHGRSGVGRWVLGSVADKIVRHSGRPVLLIRAAS